MLAEGKISIVIKLGPQRRCGRFQGCRAPRRAGTTGSLRQQLDGFDPRFEMAAPASMGEDRHRNEEGEQAAQAVGGGKAGVVRWSTSRGTASSSAAATKKFSGRWPA